MLWQPASGALRVVPVRSPCWRAALALPVLFGCDRLVGVQGRYLSSEPEAGAHAESGATDSTSDAGRDSTTTPDAESYADVAQPSDAQPDTPIVGDTQDVTADVPDSAASTRDVTVDALDAAAVEASEDDGTLAGGALEGGMDGEGGPALNESGGDAPGSSPSVEVFWRSSTNNHLMYDYFVGSASFAGTWSGPVDTSVDLGSATPRPVATGDGGVDVFWRASGARLAYVRCDASGFCARTAVMLQAATEGGAAGCQLGSDPFPVSATPGVVDVFWRGTDGSLCHQLVSNTGQVSAPLSLGGTISGSPRPVSRRDGAIEVFWIDASSYLWHLPYQSVDGGLTGMAPAVFSAPVLASEPMPVSSQPGYLDVFWRGTDSNLWHRGYVSDGGVGAWNGPENLGGGALASPPHPVAAEPSLGVLDVFWVGGDSAAWHEWYTPTNGGWYGPGSVGGSLGSEPAPTSPGDGTVHLFWRGSEPQGALWEAWYDNYGWQGPVVRAQDTGPLGSDPQAVSP